MSRLRYKKKITEPQSKKLLSFVGSFTETYLNATAKTTRVANNNNLLVITSQEL